MGFYNKEVFKKVNGVWKKQSSKIEKCPHEVGRWKRSCFLEKGSGEKTYCRYAPTRGGINNKVVSATTYYGDYKEKRTLITTSNKLPKTKCSKVKK